MQNKVKGGLDFSLDFWGDLQLGGPMFIGALGGGGDLEFWGDLMSLGGPRTPMDTMVTLPSCPHFHPRSQPPFKIWLTPFWPGPPLKYFFPSPPLLGQPTPFMQYFLSPPPVIRPFPVPFLLPLPSFVVPLPLPPLSPLLPFWK